MKIIKIALYYIVIEILEQNIYNLHTNLYTSKYMKIHLFVFKCFPSDIINLSKDTNYIEVTFLIIWEFRN